jgi:hypothetical protein
MAFCVQCGAASSGGSFCTECGTAVGGKTAAKPPKSRKKKTPTSFENKLTILADLWLNHRYDEQFLDFVEYNDLGLPLAYAVSEGIVTSTDVAEGFISETFDLLISGMGIDEDTGFESMEDLFSQATDDNA